MIHMMFQIFLNYYPVNFFRFNIFFLSQSYSKLVCLCELLLICCVNFLLFFIPQVLLKREKQATENTPYSFFKALVNGLVRCEVSEGPMEDIFICTSYTTVLELFLNFFSISLLFEHMI